MQLHVHVQLKLIYYYAKHILGNFMESQCHTISIRRVGIGTTSRLNIIVHTNLQDSHKTYSSASTLTLAFSFMVAWNVDLFPSLL